MTQNQPLQAADCFACAIQASPQNIQYKRDFIATIQGHTFIEKNKNIRAIILLCLQTDNLLLTNLTPHWISDLELDQNYKDLKAATPITSLPKNSFLEDPFFLEGLKALIIYDLKFEAFLTNLRKALLKHHQNDTLELSNSALLSLTTALAHYCFNTEYVFQTTPEEEALLQRLNKEKSSLTLALHACYAPLLTDPNPQALYERHKNNADLDSIFQQQIIEPLIQQNLKKQVTMLNEIKDNTSKAVQEQYEIFPYPRWKYLDDQIKDESAEGRFRNKQAKILVAGCGTGQEAIELSAVFPDAQITAIDLSQASLAYALFQARKFNINNINFKHADILNLNDCEERFDYITASGVLHHMKDPEKGLSILNKLLKPNGLMRIALYSEIARENIITARKAIIKNAIPSTIEGIRDFRKKAEKLIGEEAHKALSQFRDYYMTAECRDLIFHVQEHRYTLPQLETLLKSQNLKLLKLYLPNDDIKRYLKLFSKYADLKNLSNWHIYEQKYPLTFTGMYQFWCEKA